MTRLSKSSPAEKLVRRMGNEPMPDNTQMWLGTRFALVARATIDYALHPSRREEISFRMANMGPAGYKSLLIEEQYERDVHKLSRDELEALGRLLVEAEHVHGISWRELDTSVSEAQNSALAALQHEV